MTMLMIENSARSANAATMTIVVHPPFVLHGLPRTGCPGPAGHSGGVDVQMTLIEAL
jgi:hypothetical protein